MTRRPLPIGIQTLRKIRKGDDDYLAPEGAAPWQIKARGYAEKFRALGGFRST